MPSCVLRYCTSRSSQTSERGYGFFSFPPVKSTTREKWIQYVQLERSQENWMPSAASKLCSKHFKREDISFGKSGRFFLKKGSLPIGLTQMPVYFETSRRNVQYDKIEEGNSKSDVEVKQRTTSDAQAGGECRIRQISPVCGRSETSKTNSKEAMLSQLEGRSIVEMDYLFKQLQDIGSHGSLANCNLSDVQIISEVKVNMLSTFHLQCGVCFKVFIVKSCKDLEHAVKGYQEIEAVRDKYKFVPETGNCETDKEERNATNEVDGVNEKIVSVKGEFTAMKKEIVVGDANKGIVQFVPGNQELVVKKELANEEYDHSYEECMTSKVVVKKEKDAPVNKAYIDVEVPIVKQEIVTEDELRVRDTPS